MDSSLIISALATPLLPDERLHRDGFAVHFERQAASGIDGILIAGSMGAMQMLRDETYAELVSCAAQLTSRSAELLIGIGDSSYHRTVDRLRSLSASTIDGVVALPPFMTSYSQNELEEYFESLAGESRYPLFLYDLPQLSRNKLEVATVQRLSKHPNIAGIKCTQDIQSAENLFELQGPEFRVIVAKPKHLSELLVRGVMEHLDGIFALAPVWAVQIRDAVARGDSSEVTRRQNQLDSLLDIVANSNVSPYSVFTALMNRIGVPGNFAPRPIAKLDTELTQALLRSPAVIDWIRDHD